MKDDEKLHPGVYELKEQYENGKITRREFIRYATLLGVSAFLAPKIIFASGSKEAEVTTKQATTSIKIKRGGIIKAACVVMKIGHPAQLGWNAQDLFLMQVTQYLTYTDYKNITHPFLLKNWQVSDDLKTWTLNLRQGITFNNSDEFTADDVIFTFNQWLNKDIGSGMYGLIGSYLSPTGIEKVSKYQIKLHLNRPEIAVPEHLYQYPAFILNHKTFEGDFLKAPHGTGPFVVELYREGEIAKLKRRSDYWEIGSDGKPLPYVDGIEFNDMGTEYEAQIAAMKSGQIHIMNLSDGAPAATIFRNLKGDPNITIVSFPTSIVGVIRMNVTKKPYDDNRVRTALKLCQNKEKMLKLSFYGEGILGPDTHVAPVHPEYCKKPVQPYNPQKAKQLLKEAGYPNGVDLTFSVIGAQKENVRTATILKEDAAAAGFRIKIDAMPASKYWEKWTEFPLGITEWAHRPLGTMVLGLGYIGDKNGKPVPWNETHWVDKEFQKLYEEASGTYDVEKRRKIMCKLEQIQIDRGSIGIPYWHNFWSIHAKKLRDVPPSPGDYWNLQASWFET